MSQQVLVLKDEEAQQAVPSVWRPKISAIVESFRAGDFEIGRAIPGVEPVSPAQAVRMSQSVEEYGAKLASLPVESWETSVCQWMLGYWDVLVDVFDEEAGATDLVLHLRVYESGEDFVIEIRSLHVP